MLFTIYCIKEYIYLELKGKIFISLKESLHESLFFKPYFVSSTLLVRSATTLGFCGSTGEFHVNNSNDVLKMLISFQFDVGWNVDVLL
jgi:hypothetical protein